MRAGRICENTPWPSLSQFWDGSTLSSNLRNVIACKKEMWSQLKTDLVGSIVVVGVYLTATNRQI